MPDNTTLGAAGGQEIPFNLNDDAGESKSAADLLSVLDATERRRARRGSRGEPPTVRKKALSVLRGFARGQGLIVASPCLLIGQEYSGEGESEDEVQGRVKHTLVSEKELFPELHISKAWRERLEEVYDDLDAGAELDITTQFAPEDAPLGEVKGETGRWELRDANKRRVAIIVRIGDGEAKRYPVYLWWEGWYLCSGPPPYDLPLVGLGDLLAEPHKPVMVHEGPKATEGAARRARSKVASPVKAFLSQYVHVGWQGAEPGIAYTDWSPLQGRRVVVAPDMDQHGQVCADEVARWVSRYGQPVEQIVWPHELRRKHSSWDFADQPFEGFPTISQIRSWISVVESPIDHRGRVLRQFAARSAYWPKGKMIYTRGHSYQPLTPDAFNLLYGARGERNIFREVVQSPGIQKVEGSAYLPAEAYGDIVNRRVNIAQPSHRDHIAAAPLSRREMAPLWRWLKAMVPDAEQRRMLIDRAAWAISHPGVVPRFMIVLQGVSSIGKSAFFDLLCAVIGERDAAAVFPKDVFGGFNSMIANKRVVCLHEIHSNDITLKQNGERLKDLIANSTLTINEKFEKEEGRQNITHWFAATNESKPFELAHGNDRFYFCQGGRPLPMAFFEKWVPFWQSPPFLDRLYAAALAWKPKFNMRGRAPEQAEIWNTLTLRSRSAWKQNVVLLLESVDQPASDHPPCFMDTHVINLVQKKAPNVGPEDIRAFLRELGYLPVRRRKPNKEPRGWLYAKAEHVSSLRQCKSLPEVATLGGGSGVVDGDSD